MKSRVFLTIGFLLSSTVVDSLALTPAAIPIKFVPAVPAVQISIPIKFVPAAPRQSVDQRRRRSLITSSLSLLIPRTVTAQAPPEVREKIDAVVASSSEGIATLMSLIAANSRAEILEFTKNWDLEFRKARMVSCRRALLKSLKDGGSTTAEETEKISATLTALANAVTFDLIAINKCFRGEASDSIKALEYIKVMEGEIAEFVRACEATVI